MYIHSHNWKSFMPLHITKLRSRPLALAAAALVIHVGTAAAADSTGDTQQQMKELLTGTTTPQSGPRDGKVTIPTADAQESVKQLLLGTSGSDRRGAETIKHSEVARASNATNPQQRKVAYSDTHAAVQQVLLGQHHGSDASLHASRPTR
jgi:hypothetical protein